MVAQTYLQSSFGELSNYLSYGDRANGSRVEDRSERVGWEAGRNIGIDPTMEKAVNRMKHAASPKRSVKKPAYHIIISWQSGNEEEGIPPDNPTRPEMEESADRVLGALGLEGHQAWMVEHIDTDTPHMHIMVNRVHYLSRDVWSDYSYDALTIYEELREIEDEMGWHRPAPKTLEEKYARETPQSPEYWETQVGEKSVRAWAQDELREDLLDAESWPEAEHLASTCGAELVPTEDQPAPDGGMVLKKDGTHVAMSSIDPKLSRPKMSKRFGRTWETYVTEWRHLSDWLSEELSVPYPSQVQLVAYRSVERIEGIRPVEEEEPAGKGDPAGRGKPTGSGPGANKQEARAALVAATNQSPGPLISEELAELKSRLNSAQMKTLEEARSRRARWAAGTSLDFDQRAALDIARGIQREVEKSSASPPYWKREKLRSKLGGLEEEEFQELMAVLDAERKIRQVEEEIGAFRRSSDMRVEDVREALLDQREIVASRHPQDQLSGPQKEALRSLSALRSERHSTPQDYGPQTDREDETQAKEEAFRRELKNLSPEEIAGLQEHLEGEGRRLRELQFSRRAILRETAEEVSADTADWVRELLERGDYSRAVEVIGRAEEKAQRIKEKALGIGVGVSDRTEPGGAEPGGAEPGGRAEWVPPGSEHLVAGQLESRFDEILPGALAASLSDREQLQLRRAVARARAAEDRTRKGVQQDFEALGDSGQRIAVLCAVAARVDSYRADDSRADDSRADDSRHRTETARRQVFSQLFQGRDYHEQIYRDNVEEAAKLLAEAGPQDRQETAQAVREIIGGAEEGKGGKPLEDALEEAHRHRQDRRSAGKSEDAGESQDGGKSEGESEDGKDETEKDETESESTGQSRNRDRSRNSRGWSRGG